MKTVGVRELKAKLSEYLHRVREGESVVVTDRGKTIARLTPDHADPDLGRHDGSSIIRDPGTTATEAHRQKNPADKKPYATLLKETQKAWGYRTPKETLTRALEEHLRCKRQLAILDLAGTIDYDPDYDYKTARRKR